MTQMTTYAIFHRQRRHAALGDENSQNGYRFGDVILLAISAFCRLRDLVSEYITPFQHSTLYS